jgi:hypothetical protein
MLRSRFPADLFWSTVEILQTQRHHSGSTRQSSIQAVAATTAQKGAESARPFTIPRKN